MKSTERVCAIVDSIAFAVTNSLLNMFWAAVGCATNDRTPATTINAKLYL